MAKAFLVIDLQEGYIQKYPFKMDINGYKTILQYDYIKVWLLENGIIIK